LYKVPEHYCILLGGVEKSLTLLGKRPLRFGRGDRKLLIGNKCTSSISPLYLPYCRGRHRFWAHINLCAWHL